MNKKQIPTKSGKLLVVYDDLFSYHERKDWFMFVKNSVYKVNGSEDISYFNQPLQLYSSYSEKDLDNMGLLNSTGFKQIFEEHKLHNRIIRQSRVNLSPASERNNIHTDGNSLTLLYYCNLDWKIDWGGHTLFMDDKLSEAEYTCLYKPGRIVLFDGSIPHMILNPTGVAEVHRFSFAIQFE
jgi:hypothetical protein